MKVALLIIDMQKEFYSGSQVTADSLREAVWGINEAITIFRAKGWPVFAVQHVNQAEGLAPGAKGFELPDELNVLETDGHIHKTYSNAFVKTGLERQLRDLGVDTVVVSGFCAEYCVLNTCRGAEDLDFQAMLLREGIASGHPKNIAFVEEINEVVTPGALRALLA
jgi:nicotinamidase-related amidase